MAGPGNRLPDPTSPGIVLKKGKPFLGFASIGAGLFQQTVTSLLNIMYFDMTPQESIDQPFIGYNNYINNNINTVQQGAFSPKLLEAVEDMGIKIEENSHLPGYWIGITRNDETKELLGGIIPALNKGGRSVGY